VRGGFLGLVVGVGFLVCVGAAADTLSGRVVRVVDGDALVLLLPGNVQERIRLAGIDCPERRQAFGTRAKQALARFAAGKGVTVEWEKRDRYGRIVGKVVYGGTDVDLALLREG
jgi:endonuclease YncB( thermonuclease family)